MKKHTETTLLWILVALLALGQLGRMAFSPTSLLYPHDILIAFWTLFLLLSNLRMVPDSGTAFYLKIRKKYSHFTPFAAVALLTFAAAQLQQPQLLPALYLGRVGLYLLFGITLAHFSRLSRTMIERALLSLTFLLMLLGFLQLMFVPDTRFLYVLGFDDHYYRIISTQLDPAYAGALLLLLGIFTWHSPLLVKYSRLRSGILSLIFFGIGLTFSRATYVATAIVALFIWFSQNKKTSTKTVLKKGLIGLTIAAVVLLLSQIWTGEGTRLLRTASLQARVRTAQSHFPQNTREWLVGEGLFYSAVSKTTTHGLANIPNQAKFPDSFFLLILEGTGIAGLLTFLYLLVKGYSTIAKKNQLILELGLAALVLGQFNNTILQPFVLVAGIVITVWTLKEYR